MSIVQLPGENVIEYVVKIEFQRRSERPTRVFRAMAEIIDALYKIDVDLAYSFMIKIEPILILDDIEAGSLRARLSTILKAVDDDALRELDYKKIVGGFLVRAKHRILKFLEDKKEISSVEQVRELENELLLTAKEASINILAIYSPIPMQILLEDLLRLSSATTHLSPQDTACYISYDGEVKINHAFVMSLEGIQKLLTKETLISQSEMILRVKKPDYLGLSMWDVQYKGRTIPVKILDLEWLRKFQSREVDVRPGDSLRALVVTEVKYGYDNNVIAEYYTVVKVMEVMRMNRMDQQPLFPPQNGESQ